MPTLGTVASSFRFEGEHLNIRQNISTIKTTDRMEFKGVGEHANETQWTLGLDGNRHFTLQNELQDVVSISANIDTGDVFVRGAGGGGSSTLTSLTDVDTVNVQNGQMMYYDEQTNTYKFTDKIEILDAVKVLADICMNGYDIKNARDISANRRVEAPSMIAERYESPNEVQLISHKDNTGANILEVSFNNIRGYNIGTGQYLPVKIPDLSSVNIEANQIVCPNYEAISDLHLISHKDVTGASILEVSFNSLKGYNIETDQYTPVEIPKLKTDEIEPALTLDIVGNLEISGAFTNRIISHIYESRNDLVLHSHNTVTHDYLEISANQIRGVHDIVGGHTYVETNIPILKCTDLSVGELSILTDNMPEIQTPSFFHIRAGVTTNYVEFDGAQLRGRDINQFQIDLNVAGNLNVNGNVTAHNIGAPDFGRYRITPMNVSANTTPNLNLTTTGTQRGITLNGTTGIVTSSAGTYKITWNFNIVKTSGSGAVQFNLRENGNFRTMQKKDLVNFNNYSGSFVFEQIAATSTYTFTIGQNPIAFIVAGGVFQSEVTIERLF